MSKRLWEIGANEIAIRRILMNSIVRSTMPLKIQMALLVMMSVALCLSFIGSAFAQEIEYMGSTLWTYVLDVKVVGDYCYCSFTNGLVILDITDESSPYFVSQFYRPGQGRNIAVSGNYVYLSNGECGLQVIDVSQPQYPTLAGNCETPGSAVDVVVSGDYAYVIDSNLQIMDVSDPHHPTIAGSYTTEGWAQGVYPSGNYVYLADGSSGLQILEVSDPLNPLFTGSYITENDAHDVFVSGNYAYVTDVHYHGCSLRIIDISNPADPTLTGTIATDMAFKVFVEGNYAYVADAFSLLKVIDVSDPYNPIIVADYTGSGHTVDVSSGYAHVAGSGGLHILDVSNPTDPIFTGIYETPYAHNAAYFSGHYAYVVDGGSLYIADVSDPSSPEVVSRYDMQGSSSPSTRDVFVADNYAYVACGDISWPAATGGLQIIDVSDPLTPSVIGSHDTAGYANNVFVLGSYAYVTVQSRDRLCFLQIVDVTNPSDPTFIGSYGITGGGVEAEDMFVEGSYAYVTYTHNLQIIDISDPSNPRSVGNYTTPHRAFGVFVSGDYAYVADENSGLLIVDVSDPSNPSLMGSCYPGGSATDVFVWGRYACVVDHMSPWGDLYVIDVSNPSNPTLVGTHDAGRATGVSAADDYIYVSSWFSLTVLQFDPVSGIISPFQASASDVLVETYPNPFNPVTTFRIELPAASWVTLEILDISGRSLGFVMDGWLSAGRHELTFEASGLVSGVYVHRLEAGEFRTSGKMVLMK